MTDRSVSVALSDGGDNATTRGGKTRARILSAAAMLLSDRGYAATTLGDIAREAGLRPPGLYHYFPSREMLIAEVIETGQRVVLDHVTDELRAAGPTADEMDRIATAVEAHLRVELELSDFANAVTRNAGQVPADVASAAHDGSDAYHRLWRELLDAAVASGHVRQDLDLGVARMLIVGALNWTPEWWGSVASDDLETLMHTARSFVRHSLADNTNAEDDRGLNLC